VVFRRRRQQDTDDVLAEAYDTEAETEQEPVGATTDATSMPSDGPWDEADLDDPSAGRVDLGGLLIPAVQGMELRAEIADDRIIAATVVLADSAVQLQPFAAPRHEGIWDEVRGELAATVTKQGGTVDESSGPFGPELRARVSVNPPAGKTGSQLARFLGKTSPPQRIDCNAIRHVLEHRQPHAFGQDHAGTDRIGANLVFARFENLGEFAVLVPQAAVRVLDDEFSAWCGIHSELLAEK